LKVETVKSKTSFRLGARSRIAFALAGALSMAVGCGGGGATPNEAIEPGTFLAFETSFRAYHQWEPFPVETEGEIPNSPHLAGKRTAYLNQRPPSGSTSFPVGTIIVKEIVNDDPTKNDVVARVKRGGTYNARGATGWEWFELRTPAEGTAGILWRGVGPPSGEGYLGNVQGGCNACHAGGDDVSILLPALQLTNF
jgi:hypothetical protein